ncbi:paraquat-inducible protein A [Pseudomonas sp. N040]|uniref:paraquat-inducible protein A n=1 Tax=Pseudomonas sp. N040 TaxID=2785325 RepID=UPI0018A2FE4B|nr:paraquat-inducible protein A [Pseudomonas sp. N040]MBF7730655.1 paraquat-inducible protein A [Pseudomonas sp. N040]MBW7014298.1 paraquat-inducible protein A [Pseudomonas sp. N040]
MRQTADCNVLADKPLDQLVACHECDLLMLKPHLANGERADCPRCGFELYRHNTQVVKRSLALVIAALLLFIPASFFPIMQINVLGQTSQDTVWTGVVSLYEAGGVLQSIAVVVFLSSMVIPFLKLMIQFLVLLSIRLDVGRAYGLFLYRIYHQMREWGMLEVYLMGILVSIVKLIDIAKPTIGVGLVCFISLLLIQVWLEVTMAPHQIWEALAEGDSNESH